jgi:uncharacterized protein (DUF305 family)
MPKALDSEHERLRENVQTLHGKAFDEQYMHGMVEDHIKAVKLFQQEERSGHNAELKKFAQKTLPTLQEHQKMALELVSEGLAGSCQIGLTLRHIAFRRCHFRKSAVPGPPSPARPKTAAL